MESEADLTETSEDNPLIHRIIHKKKPSKKHRAEVDVASEAE
jgi:hypothetical protein